MKSWGNNVFFDSTIIPSFQHSRFYSVISVPSVAKFFSFLQICQAMQRVRYLQYPLGSGQVQHSLQYPWLYLWQMEKAFRSGWLMQFMGFMPAYEFRL